MEYDFQRHEPYFDKAVFVLTLDRKKMKERNVAGKEAAIRSRLRGNANAEVICDMVRPLGTFFIDFEQDPDGEWNRYGLAPLREALHTNSWKQPGLEKAAGSFLSQKYQTGDPVRQYAAFRIWEGYLAARAHSVQWTLALRRPKRSGDNRNRSAACDRFIESVSPFTLAFQTNTTADFEKHTGRPAPLDPSHRLPAQLLQEDASLALWYPDKNTSLECACIYTSFYPAMVYYLNRLKDWGFISGSAKYAAGFSWQKASGMNYVAKNAGKHSLCRTSVSLTNGQGKIITTCFIRMNARTGATRSAKRKRQTDFRKKGWKK